MSHHLRQLLLQICRMEQVAVAYRCDCGLYLILANFQPSVLQQETQGIDVLVLRISDRVACPECGAPLAPVWHAAEMVLAEDMLARLASLDADCLVRALQMELREIPKARLKCN